MAADAASSSLIRNEGTMTEPFILTMSCPNQRGIVSKISTAIFRANGDILEADPPKTDQSLDQIRAGAVDERP